MERFSCMWSQDLGDAIGKAMVKEKLSHYNMSLVGSDRLGCILAVNQGIDSHLEACNVPDRGDYFADSGSRLTCKVSAQSLIVLVRRLLENGDDNGMGLASGICSTLEIELI